MKRTAILTLALILPLLASACNTISGAGEDVAAGGKAVSNTASQTKDNMENH